MFMNELNPPRHIREILQSARPSDLELPPSSNDKKEPERKNVSVKPKNADKLPDLETAWQRRWLGLKCTHLSVQTAATATERFCADWLKHQTPGRKLILFGSSGCGKTAIVLRVMNWARQNARNAVNTKQWNKWPMCKFIRWQSIIDDLESGDSIATIVDPLAEESMLGIDDIGAESDRFKGGKPADALAYLLSLCQRRTWLIISTNEAPETWAERWDTRVEDRLLRDAEIIDMRNSPSWSQL